MAEGIDCPIFLAKEKGNILKEHVVSTLDILKTKYRLSNICFNILSKYVNY